MSLYTLNLFVHVLATVVWAGGMIFLGPIAAPALRRLEPPATRAQAFQAVGRRFRPVGWACIVLLVLTGIFNVIFLRVDLGNLLASGFGHRLLTKLVLVAVAIALSALHDFVWGPRAFALGPDHAEGQRLRRWSIAIARLNTVLVLLIIFLGVGLRG
ncbi:MAG: DUF4149 domain-containing protein [Gemmatimonadota bacterium]